MLKRFDEREKREEERLKEEDDFLCWRVFW
jgi:hypothetical protein